MDAALKLGADVIVNTDADNQYRGAGHRASSSRRSSPARADMVIGDRDVASIERVLAAQEAPAAARLGRRARRLGDRRARHDLGLSRLQPRGGAADHHRLALHLHARVDHPGRQAARRDRPRPDPHQPQDAAVAAVPVDVVLRAPQRRLDLPHLRPVRAAARVPGRRRGAAARRRSASGPSSSSPTRRATAPATSSR